jgi:hypothetical protein
MKKNRPQSRKENLVEQELDGELLIYDLERNKAFCLNRTSMLVWQSCDGKRTIAEINDALGKQLNSGVDEDIVWLALDQLQKENLVDGERFLPDKYGDMDRRDVIKRIGLASAISLPVIAAMMAPTAAHANSLCMTVIGGCSCGTNPMGTNPDGSCIPGGALQMTCADMANCRCVEMGVGMADDCLP